MYVIARVFAGPVMALAGLNHFVMPDAYVSIMPGYVPAHLQLVYVSGIIEMLGGLGTLHPRTRRPAGLVLIATLVAIFPANVHMALNASDYPDVPGGTTALVARLPLQVLFIYWVWLAAVRKRAVRVP